MGPRVLNNLKEPVDGSSLAVFRILFGGILFWEVLRYVPRIDERYAPRAFHFRFPLFEFVRPLPGDGMYWAFLGLGVVSLGLLLGVRYRLCAWLCLAGFAYVFLLEKAHYLNHFYLVLLLSFLSTVVAGHASLSADGWGRERRIWGLVPAWQLYLIRFQILVVYFYGGVAKLNGDWLRGEPLHHWLANRGDLPWVGELLTRGWAPYFFSWGGLVFDLGIGFLLLAKATRPLAILGVVAFNLSNHFLFNIGIFPWVMIAAVVLFLEPETPRRALQAALPLLRRDVVPPAPRRERWPWRPVVVGSYVAFQLLFPLRHWLYPGNVSWTEEGHNFSWHMKLRDKDAMFFYQVEDGESGERFPVPVSRRLSHRQIAKMASRPQMILQYAHFLRDELKARGVDEPIVRAHVIASLNGRPYRYLIDPETNLAQAEYSLFRSASWIRPLDGDEEPGHYITSAVARRQVFELMVLGRIRTQPGAPGAPHLPSRERRVSR